MCHALNFTDGALCVVYNARYGRGTGRKNTYASSRDNQRTNPSILLIYCEQGESGWIIWTVLLEMRSLRIAVTGDGGSATAPTGMMLELSVDPMVNLINQSLSHII